MIVRHLLSSLLLVLGSSAALHVRAAVEPSLAVDQLQQFELKDYDYIGKSSSDVCAGDFSVSGVSCVTADLIGIGISPLTVPLQYKTSRVLSMSDDLESHEVFVYVYRFGDDITRDYSKISMTLNAESFYAMRMPDEDTSFFHNYNITPVSMSADYSLVKYRITDLVGEVDWRSEEREYVVREVIDWENRTSDKGILPSGMIYGVRHAADGSLEVTQNSLNVYTAKQLLVESYIHIADQGGLPLNYDSRIQGQSILLFDIYKNDEIFLEKLRAVELQASYYQWFGATTLPVESNAERGEKVVEEMIREKWISGEKGTMAENFHKKNVVDNETIVITPASHKIDYKPSFWHWWQTRSYAWNDLDFCKNLDKANKHIDGSLLNKYTYYAVLKTFDFEVSPKPYKDNWQIADRSDQYLPYTFTDVSLASFWYDEGEKVKQGIVMSTYNDSYGTVQLVSPNDNAMPSYLKIVIAVVAVIVLLILLQVFGILIPIFKACFSGIAWFFKGIAYLIKYLVLGLSWPIRAIYHKVKGD